MIRHHRRPERPHAERRRNQAIASRFIGRRPMWSRRRWASTHPTVEPIAFLPKAAGETVDITLFAGARLWSGAEVWINPEIDQGFGLDKALGVAGFPSRAAYKVGKNQPYLRLPRLFARQTIDF